MRPVWRVRVKLSARCVRVYFRRYALLPRGDCLVEEMRKWPCEMAKIMLFFARKFVLSIFVRQCPTRTTDRRKKFAREKCLFDRYIGEGMT